MALATRCPHCATTFRVAHDQLKLRAGLVRCGACKQIFNGVENLLGPEIPVPAPTSQPANLTPRPSTPPRVATPPLPPAPRPAPSKASNSRMPVSAGTASPDSLRLSPPTTAFPPNRLVPPEPSPDADKDVDPLTRMTLMDFTFFEEDQAPSKTALGKTLEHAMERATSDTESPDEIEQAIQDLHSRPWRDEHAREAATHSKRADDDKDEPGFVKHARRRQKMGSTLKWVYGLGSLLLILLLAGQLAYSFRDQLAQRLPQSAPYLQQACVHLNCSIAYPTSIKSLAIESSELQAIPAQANTFLLRVLLRNNYDTAVAWPHLELTLDGHDENPVARRGFSPSDYLPAAEQAQTGFSAQSEQAISLRFVLENTKASGFQVYLFYP